MLGAIIGDIIGSVYEFNNFRSKDFEPLFHRKAFFTDDTVCTVAGGRCSGQCQTSGRGSKGLGATILGEWRLGAVLCPLAWFRES